MTRVAERLLAATVTVGLGGDRSFEEVRIEVLARIAGGLCCDAAVTRVERGPDDSWSWNARTGVLRVGRRALREYGVEACAGILAHEVGHALLSRYHLVLRAGDLAKVSWRCMNALEDPRVEAWMASRYPGVGPWLQAAAARSLAGWEDRHLPALRAEQWALGACVDGAPDVPGLSRALLARLLPDVRESLDRTRSARLHYRDGFLPPVDLDAWTPLTPHAVETYAVLQRRFALEGCPADAEKVARIHAVHACCFAQTDILPAARGAARCQTGRQRVGSVVLSFAITLRRSGRTPAWACANVRARRSARSPSESARSRESTSARVVGTGARAGAGEVAPSASAAPNFSEGRAPGARGVAPRPTEGEGRLPRVTRKRARCRWCCVGAARGHWPARMARTSASAVAGSTS